MPRLTIDGRPVEVPPGTTLLAALRGLGLDVPTLCHQDGLAPFGSCQVCQVRDLTAGRMIPSCLYPATDGMAIDASSAAVRAARRTALELLLGEHVGDCLGPCTRGCPANLDIPAMLRALQGGDPADALRIVRDTLPIPAVLGRICMASCENVCRRQTLDAPLAIRTTHGVLAERDLAAGAPGLPDRAPPTGRRIAIVGAGPAGLAAGYFLTRQGHDCTLHDLLERPGGALRYAVPEARLPKALLDAEIAWLERGGLRIESARIVLPAAVPAPAPPGATPRKVALEDLLAAADAVLLATGGPNDCFAHGWAVDALLGDNEFDRKTFQTKNPKLFSCGSLKKTAHVAVQAVARGRRAAHSIHRWLTTGVAEPERAMFLTHIRDLTGDEARAMAGAELARPVGGLRRPAAPETVAAAALADDAGRCLHCDCRRARDCKLRLYADAHAVRKQAFRADHRPPFALVTGDRGILFEPGKCIKCGLCVRLTAASPAAAGMTFLGRGDALRVGPPFGVTLDDALGDTGPACVAACPTAALARA